MIRSLSKRGKRRGRARTNGPTLRRPDTPRASRPAAGGPVAPSREYVGGRRPVTSRAFTAAFPRVRKPAKFVRNTILVVLIVASLGMMTVTYRGGVVLSSAQLVVLDVVAPIERGIQRAWSPIDAGWAWTGALLRATDENPKLREENERLRSQIASERAHTATNLRWARITSLTERGTFPNGFDKVYASTIVRSSASSTKSMTVNAGRVHGVQKNNAVIGPGGALVGRVSAVSRTTAVVDLLINPDEAISAVVVERSAAGLVTAISSEGSAVLEMHDIEVRAPVEKYDVVATSGWVDRASHLASKYPKDIPIGWVSSVSNDASDLTKHIQVTPYTNFDRLDEVIILVKPVLHRGGDR